MAMELYSRKKSDVTYSEGVGIPYPYVKDLFEAYLGEDDYTVNENYTYWVIDRDSFVDMIEFIESDVKNNSIPDIRIYHHMKPEEVLSSLLYLYGECDKSLDVIILEYF